MKSLVVEDNLSAQIELQSILENYGPVDTADNGKLGLDAFRYALTQKASYDLVVMDIRMPEMDGQTALVEMRKAEFDLFSSDRFIKKKYAVIIMLTSLEDPKHLIDAYHKGKCNGYLNKPVDMDELLDKLRRNKLIE